MNGNMQIDTFSIWIILQGSKPDCVPSVTALCVAGGCGTRSSCLCGILIDCFVYIFGF